MIKQFDKDVYEHHNAIQLAWLFLVTELHEFFIYVKAFNAVDDVYNYRRVFWFTFGVLAGLGFIGLISITCVLYVVNFFLRIM